jgi:hypothetical protein
MLCSELEAVPAVVACVRGCECAESTLDGHWTNQASQGNGHYVTVTPHPQCVLRVTVLDDTDSGERKVLTPGVLRVRLQAGSSFTP